MDDWGMRPAGSETVAGAALLMLSAAWQRTQGAFANSLTCEVRRLHTVSSRAPNTAHLSCHFSADGVFLNVYVCVC